MHTTATPTPTDTPSDADLDHALATFERIITAAQIPAPRTTRYDLDIAHRADDIHRALAGLVGHRAPLAFHEIAQRDTDLGDHSGAGARHRKTGAPCTNVLRARKPQNSHGAHPMSEQPTYSTDPIPTTWTTHADTHAGDPSQPIVAAALHAGSAIRLLASQLAGLSRPAITAHTETHDGYLPTLAIQCHGPHNATDATTLAARLHLPPLTAAPPTEHTRGHWTRHLHTRGTWRGYDIEVTAVIDAPDAADAIAAADQAVITYTGDDQ